MPQNFVCPERDQPLLLPVDMREWLPEDDLVFVVLDAVATVDLDGFRRRYRAGGHGRAAFDPGMMVALLLYGYCQGERSSRVIEKRCVRDVGYRVITGGLRPDHATIARFRARHEKALGGLFSQVLRLLAAEAMVALGMVSLDGTKLAGNAAQKANKTLPQIEKILAEAAKADAEDAQQRDGLQAATPRVLAPPAGRTLLHPLLDTCRQQLTEAGIGPKLRTVLADSGYASEASFARAGADGLRLLAPLAKDPGRRRIRTPQRARHLDRFPATARARRRLQHPRGREDYRIRARTVEPVFGQLKTCQKMTMMSRRGLTACQSEWLLACAAHNLRKLHRHRTER